MRFEDVWYHQFDLIRYMSNFTVCLSSIINHENIDLKYLNRLLLLASNNFNRAKLLKLLERLK